MSIVQMPGGLVEKAALEPADPGLETAAELARW